MDAEILDDLKQVNDQLIKQEQSLKQIMKINHMQNVQYVQQVQNIQHIQQIQSRVNAQVEKTGTALKKTSVLFGGFKAVAATVGGAITGAFSVLGTGGFLTEAVTEADALADKFLVLRLSLGKLKSAIGEAVAPIISAFLPAVQQAVYAATRLVKTVGKVIAALFGGTAQTEDMAAAQEQLAASSGKATKELASFDKIERLGKSSGGSGSAAEVTLPRVQDTLTPQLQAVVDKIRSLMAKLVSLLAPLKEIDFNPAAEAFHRLRQAVLPFGKTLFAGLEWAWHNLLVPLAAWTAEKVLPTFLDLFSGALSLLNSVVTALKPLAVWLWEGFLQPVGKWVADSAVAALGFLTEKLQGVSGWISQNGELLREIVTVVGSFAAAWIAVNGALSTWKTNGQIVVAAIEGVKTAFDAVNIKTNLVALGISALITVITLLIKNWEAVKTAAVSTWESITATFSAAGTWFQQNVVAPVMGVFSSMWTGLQEALKTPINGIIGMLNALLSGITAGINAMIRGLNKLSFTVPKWVPVLGGESLGFNLSTVKTPQIPYLAQGAVLPANKPFLAVVGDQKHGTNIEAPLETIRQALAEVMAAQGQQEIAIRFTGDLAQLGRVLKPVIDRENRRVGASLVKGAY